jgi:serine/threonine protein phosphatase PrpC
VFELRSLVKNIFGAESQPQAFVVRCGFRADAGRVRDHNEDSVLFERAASPKALERRGLLAVVADGMGGHAAGEVASNLACQTVKTRYFSESGSVDNALHSALKAANDVIFEASQRNIAQTGMGTTCIAVAIVGFQSYFAWVGDSRLYMIRNREIYRLSEDHTVVRDMVKDGLIDAAAAAIHPERNVLSRALGTKRDVEISLCERPTELLSGDRLVLCSDGLHDLISDNELLLAIEGLDEKRATDTLIALANERGGLDNISVIIIDVLDPKAQTVVKTKLRETREATIP